MKIATDPMTAVFAHDGHILLFGVTLNGMADIAQSHARSDHLDTDAHALVTDPCYTPRDNRRLTDEKHLAGVAVITVLNDRDIDIDDVAVLEDLAAGDAVADLVIDRGTYRFRKPVVIERCRDRLLHLGDVVVTQTIQFLSGYARAYVGAYHRQYLARETARDAHLGNFLRCLDMDAHGIVASVRPSAVWSPGGCASLPSRPGQPGPGGPWVVAGGRVVCGAVRNGVYPVCHLNDSKAREAQDIRMICTAFWIMI